MKTIHTKTFGIVIIYFVVGCLWILFTDRIILNLFSDVVVLTYYQTFKGWFYVFGTTVLLFVLINRQLIKLGRVNTELKASNASKTEMLAKLNQAQFNAKIGSWDWNLTSGETWWSDQMYSILALNERKPLLMTDFVDTLVTKQERKRIQVALQLLIQEQKNLNIDFNIVTASGQLKTLNLIGRAEVNREGGMNRVYGTLMDITDRKLAEEALIEKETLYRTLIERMPDGVYKISQDHNFVEVNPALVKMLGYNSREELMAADINTQLLVYGAVHESLVFERMWNEIAVFKLRKKDGTEIWVENHGWQSSGNNNSNLFYEGVIRDITDRKNAEDALRESQLLFENLTKASPSGIFRCGTDGYVTYFNPRWVELAGLPLVQALGFGWLNAVHPDDRNILSEKWQSDETQKSESLEFRFLRPDGRVVYVIEYIVPEIIDDQITGYIGTITDITERRQAEAEVVMLNSELEKRVARRTAQLKAANDELEAFSYSISHDLRAPLRALDGFAHFLLDDYSSVLDEEGKRLLQVIIDNANKMGLLIDDLLEFARLNRNSLKISKINMQAMAQNVFDELIMGQPPGHGIDFRLHPLAEAYGDAAMIKQVWTNLIGNALKYTSKKPERIIEISCIENGRDYCYKISDNGAGFSMTYYNKLFGVFQRLHTVAEFEGTGIGLAIVNRIVQRHNGRVWAEGEVNKGATFYFALPKNYLSL